MRVAVVAGPDPGHAFPAIALSRRLLAAGDEPVIFTGRRWLNLAGGEGIEARPLDGLAPRPGDDDLDAGQRIHERAAYISSLLLPALRAVRPDLVVSDVLTAGGGLAAERLNIPWAELSPHPLYAPSKGLPPIGSGLAAGCGWSGRARDVLLRAATARALRMGERQRAAARRGVGLAAGGPGPAARLIATLPALEVPRPDWPADAHVVGPLLWEPTANVLALPPGDQPLVMLAPSTAHTGAEGLTAAAVAALSGMQVRLAISALDGLAGKLPGWAVAGLGRQDELLRHSAVVICGGGHGLLAKSLLAGVPSVTVPGGGDQWELANRACRQGSSVLVRPLSVAAIRAAVTMVLADPGYRRAAVAASESAVGLADPVEICRNASVRAAC